MKYISRKLIQDKVKTMERLDLTILSSDMINLYFNKFYNTEEGEYIRNLKASSLYIDMLEWLLSNYGCCRKEGEDFSFAKQLKKIDKKLYNHKKRLFFQWKLGYFARFKAIYEDNIDKKEEIKARLNILKSNIILDTFHKIEKNRLQKILRIINDKYFYSLVYSYAEYTKDKESNFKKEIGLK